VWPGFEAPCGIPGDGRLSASWIAVGEGEVWLGASLEVVSAAQQEAGCHQKCDQRPAPPRNGVHSSSRDCRESHTRKAANLPRERRSAKEDLKSGAYTGAANASIELTVRQVSGRSATPRPSPRAALTQLAKNIT